MKTEEAKSIYPFKTRTRKTKIRALRN